MKLFYRVLLVLICACTGGFTYAQNTLDSRLLEFYGQEQIDKMRQSAPGTVEYLNYYVQHGYVIIEGMSEQKLQQFKNITSIKFMRSGKNLTAKDVEGINILNLDIRRKPDQHLTYRIGASNNVIVFVAPNEVRRRFREEGKR